MYKTKKRGQKPPINQITKMKKLFKIFLNDNVDIFLRSYFQVLWNFV